jgi:uncharacterized membrane protein YfcA
VEVVAVLGVLFGAVAQAVTGFGFSLVTAPLLVAAYGAPEGVQVNVVLAVGLNLLLLVSGRRHVDARAAGRLLVPAVVATVVVGRLIRGSDNDAVTVVAGLLCLVGVGAVARGRTLRRLTGATGTVVVGALSGAMNVAAGIGGPPVVLFGTTAGWTPQVARPTLQLFFLGINAVALATLGLPDEITGWMVAAVVVGLAVGQVAARRLREDQIRAAVLVTAAAGSLLAVVRGLT